MRTEELIGALEAAAQARPARMLTARRLGAEVAGLVALAVAVFLLTFGPRDNLGAVIGLPLVAIKTALPFTLALITLPLALASLRPEAKLGPRLWLFALPATVAVGLWALTFLRTPAPARFVEVTPGALAECLGLILVLATLPALAALRLARRGAPTHPARAGALFGLAVSAGAATGYSFFCTQDNPLFYLTWYGVAIAAVTLVSARLGARWLAW